MTQSFADPGTPQGGGATRTATVQLNANVSGYTSQMGAAAQQTGLLSRGVDQLAASMGGLNKWAGKKLFHFAEADFALLGAGAADAATFQKQLSTLAAGAAVTGGSMKGLKSGIESAFQSLPTSRGQIIALVEAITNMGVTSNSSITSLTQTFIKLGAATGEPMTQLASGLIQLSRLMGSTDATQIGNFANSLLTVSKNAGVSASGVLEFSQAIAPIARQAGISEGAVLGISTAFTKAGADGYVAANTFNSMLSDITTSIATGSPQLAKYANLLGVTTGTFKKMDKQSAIVDIFNTIGQLGPKAINILDSLGITGTRAQSAIAAVTQSGGLQSSIDQSLNAQGNQGNLNKGAKAAFNNLADTLARTRNEFTQMGTEIGTTFLGPMQAVVMVVDKVAHSMNNLVKPLAPILGVAGVAAGAAGAAGGLALNLAGPIGAYALMNTMRHGVGGAMMSAGIAQRRGGVLNQQQQVMADRFARGEGTIFQRMMFRGGLGVGGVLGQRGAADNVRTGLRGLTPGEIRNLGIAGIFRLPAALSRANEGFLRNSRRSALTRLQVGDEEQGQRIGFRQRFATLRTEVAGRDPYNVAGMEARRMAAQFGRTAGQSMVVGGQIAQATGRRFWQLGAPRMVGSMVGSMFGFPGAGRVVNQSIGALPDARAGDEIGKMRMAAAKFTSAMPTMVRAPAESMKVLGASTKELGIAMGRLTAATVKQGLAAGVSVGGTVLGKVGSVVGQVGSRALGAAFSLPGLLGIEAATQLTSKISDRNAQVADQNQFLNPITKYNDALGIATTKLASFADGLTNSTAVTKRLNGVTANTKLSDVAKVSATDVTQAIGAKDDDSTLKAVAKSVGTKSPRAQEALKELAQSYNFTDPRQLQLFKSNALAQGYKQDVVTKALAGIGGAPASPWAIPDYQTLGRTAQQYEGVATGALSFVGYGGSSASDTGKKVRQAAVTAIKNQSDADSTHGAGYAQQKQLSSTLKFLAGELQYVGGGSASDSEFGQAARGLLGGGSADAYTNKAEDLRSDKNGSISEFGANPDKFSEAQREQMVLKLIGKTDYGKKYLKQLGAQGVNVTDPSAMLGNLGGLYNQGIDNAQYDAFNVQTGGLRLTGSKLAQASVDAPENMQAQRAAMLEQYSGATTDFPMGKLNTGIADVVGSLGRLAAVSGDTSTGLGLIAQQAATYARQEQQTAMHYMSRPQQLGQTVANYQQSSVNLALAGPNAPQATIDAVTGDKQAYEQAKAGYTDYLTQTYQQFQQYNTQMKRSAYDEHLQETRSTAAFHLQMQNASDDFLRQRNRTQQDMDRQLANSAATAAQSIYDPYKRVQAQYTVDGGTLLQNLQDQNRRIAGQQSTVAKLHKEGLSTKTIQTLDLANPANAQEANNLVDSLAQNPKLIAQINAQATKRLKGTAALTQSAYNLQFVQSQQEFQTQLKRTQQDYDTATSRANAAQSLAMGNMAMDYRTMTSRAAADLNTSITDLFGTFATSYGRVMGQVGGQLKRFAPDAAKTMLTQLDIIKTKYPMLLDDKWKPSNSPPPITHNGIPVSERPTRVVHAAATGGIFPSRVGGSFAQVAEAGAPEAVIPLNDQGQSFMAGLIARSLGSAFASYSGGSGGSSSTTRVDSSTNYGPVTVVAQDTAAFEREMKAKNRLRKLTSPSRH